MCVCAVLVNVCVCLSVCLERERDNSDLFEDLLEREREIMLMHLTTCNEYFYCGDNEKKKKWKKWR